MLVIFLLLQRALYILSPFVAFGCWGRCLVSVTRSVTLPSLPSSVPRDDGRVYAGGGGALSHARCEPNNAIIAWTFSPALILSPPLPVSLSFPSSPISPFHSRMLSLPFSFTLPLSLSLTFAFFFLFISLFPTPVFTPFSLLSPPAPYLVPLPLPPQATSLHFSLFPLLHLIFSLPLHLISLTDLSAIYFHK